MFGEVIMIIWISGAYGVGKSTLASALVEKIDNSIVFDAEIVGNAVRGNYPDEPYGVIFEDYPLWCEFNYRLLKDIHETFHRNILVPMTMIRQSSYEKIIRRLLEDGIDTKLIVLTGTYQCIYDRLLARGEEEGCWCMKNIRMSSEGSAAIPNSYHIITDQKTVEELTRIVLAYIGDACKPARHIWQQTEQSPQSRN